MRVSFLSLMLAAIVAGCVQEGSSPPKTAAPAAQTATAPAQPKAGEPSSVAVAAATAAPRVSVRLRDTLQRDTVVAAFRRSPMEAQAALARVCPAASGMKVVSVGAAGDLVLEGPAGANAAQLAARLQSDPAVAMAQAEISVKF